MLEGGVLLIFLFFFFNDTSPTEISTLSLHDALPISIRGSGTCGGSFSQAPRVPGAKGRRRRPPTRRPALDPAPRALLAADMRSPFFPSDAQQKEIGRAHV